MIGIICCKVVLALQCERYVPKFFYVMKQNRNTVTEWMTEKNDVKIGHKQDDGQ